MRGVDEIRHDLAGFAPPACPACQPGEPTLDDEGFFCERCGDPIDNGAEFDDILKELRLAKKAVA